MPIHTFTAYLHEHIPLSRQLGVVVEHHDGASIRLAAPLAPNLNHRSTAFGGSLSAVAILSGWALVHLALRERGIANQLVIQRSTVDFQEPVAGDFVVTATLPPAAEWDRFLATLARHHRARVRVRGTIECPPAVGGLHEGTYVALRA
jgi:thioesterase domain-containing protein